MCESCVRVVCPWRRGDEGKRQDLDRGGSSTRGDLVFLRFLAPFFIPQAPNSQCQFVHTDRTACMHIAFGPATTADEGCDSSQGGLKLVTRQNQKPPHPHSPKTHPASQPPQ